MGNKTFSLIGVCALAIASSSCERAPGSAPYEGRYAKGSLALVTVSHQDEGLAARPLFWRSTQMLKRASADSFVVATRPERSLVFVRNADGAISGAQIRGLGDDGFYRRLPEAAVPPVLGLFEGDAVLAAQQLIKDSTLSSDELLDALRQFLRWPSKAPRAALFAQELAAAFPDDDRIMSSWGDALVAAGAREEALSLFERAIAINGANDDAARALVRMGRRSAAHQRDALRLSFTLEELFSPPTREEISDVWKAWSSRDLESGPGQEVERRVMTIAGMEATVRIVAHRVHGDLHYGAILVPHGGASGPRPVIVEARGVSWDYRPLDLEHDLGLPTLLREHRTEFIYVIPSFRGERMVLGTREYVSQGDRTDAWDGATDDALALLGLALRTTQGIDTAKIGIFGRSRGGSVALLAGIREKRIRAVVSWAAPIDWFSHMGADGWTLEEIVREGLSHNAGPGEPGGQFIERYLRRASEQERKLSFARQRMIAGSPLYFLHRLPRVSCSYGLEDNMVPVQNARSLLAAFQGDPDRQCHIIEGAGHDLGSTEAARFAREFLMQTLLAREGK